MKIDLHSMKSTFRNSLYKLRGEKKAPGKDERSATEQGPQSKPAKIDHRQLHDFSAHLRNLERKIYNLKEITKKWKK